MSRTFVYEISRVFKLWVADNNSSINIEGCNTSVLHDINKVGDCNNNLKSLRKDNLNKLVFAHLNINSIRNKSDLLSEQIKGNADVLIISETKIDDSFPVDQFLIEGLCTPESVREDISSNLITVDINLIGNFYVELNLRNNK